MKKILPIIIAVFGFIFFAALCRQPIFAQIQQQQAPVSPSTNSNSNLLQQFQDFLQGHQDSQVPENNWVQDQEVTFVGKTAVRAQDFLTWALKNYDWACVKQVGTSCDNSDNPLQDFWGSVRNIVYAFLILFVLAAAFIIIITRGQNLTIMRFIPRFVIVVALVTLSFSLVQIIFVSTDIVQGCFLRLDCRDAKSELIGKKNLLYVQFEYPTFIGYRKIGPENEESAFISLLLVRLTAYTYYAMTLILLVRKIILWFFIIVSAVFPLLLFYSPLRNTAKIWVGEFFRWLLYAPLFALFLHGLVMIWQRTNVKDGISGIPLAFDFTKVGVETPYPTAINILLGGPGQSVSSLNSVNLSDTFAQYVVSLLMLWVVILLPFLLLNIFLDYLKSLSFGSLKNKMVVQQLLSKSKSIIGGPSSPMPPPQGAGSARALPLPTAGGAGAVRTIEVQSNATFHDTRAATEIMKLTNLSIPKMRDIAKYESSLISKSSTHKQEASHVSSTLQKIANPAMATTPAERERFTTMKEKLVQQKQKGDPVATSILSASSVVSNNSTAFSNRAVSAEANKSSSTSTTTTGKSVSTEVNKSTSTTSGTKAQIGTQVQQFGISQARLPVINKVQQVSLEDYEEVRKMWAENYKSLEPPKSIDGQNLTRRQWIKADIEKINQAVNSLMSIDPQKNKEGMDMVANILPFLLIGGFSRSEVIAYLKAKLEAAKSTVADVEKKEEDEDALIERQEKHAEAKQEMSAEAPDPSTNQKEMGNHELPDNPIFDNDKK